MIKGRKEEALQVLARLHARGDTSDTFVQAEYAEIEAKVTAESQVASGWAEVSKNALKFANFAERSDVDLPRPLQLATRVFGYHSPILRSDDRCICHSVLRPRYFRRDWFQLREDFPFPDYQFGYCTDRTGLVYLDC